MKRSFLRLIPAVLILLFAACSGEKQRKMQDVQDEYITQPISSVDTSDYHAVMVLGNRYMDLLKAGKIDSAVNMLFFLQGDSVVELPKSLVERQKAILRQFPVIDYTCESINFYSETDNQIKYKVQFFEKEPDDPRPNTTSMFLKPVRRFGVWTLTVADTDTSGGRAPSHIQN